MPKPHYRIEFERPARRQFDSLPADVKRRVATAIDKLAGSPRPHGAIKLAGDSGEYRIRVGHYRVIYEIRDNMLIVTVVKVAHRSEAYRER
jgi:mRNA interferase RelE/StbE